MSLNRRAWRGCVEVLGLAMAELARAEPPVSLGLLVRAGVEMVGLGRIAEMARVNLRLGSSALARAGREPLGVRRAPRLR